MKEVAWLSQVANGPCGANLLHAQAACSHVEDLLTRGSNALHDAKVPPGTALELHDRVWAKANALALEAVGEGKISSEIARKPDGRRVTTVSLADYARYAEPAISQVGYAYCALQASVAYSYLVQHLPPHTPVDLCQVQGIDHVLVVIGRRPGSDPLNMNSWGPQAVVCDPWANRCYPLSEYAEMQRSEHDVKRHVGASNGHYLGGPLQVVDGNVGLN